MALYHVFEKYTEVISARNVLVLELGQEKCGFSDVVDLVRAGCDVVERGRCQGVEPIRGA
jgi:hypothetical protein